MPGLPGPSAPPPASVLTSLPPGGPSPSFTGRRRPRARNCPPGPLTRTDCPRHPPPPFPPTPPQRQPPAPLRTPAAQAWARPLPPRLHTPRGGADAQNHLAPLVPKSEWGPSSTGTQSGSPRPSPPGQGAVHGVDSTRLRSRAGSCPRAVPPETQPSVCWSPGSPPFHHLVSASRRSTAQGTLSQRERSLPALHERPMDSWCGRELDSVYLTSSHTVGDHRAGRLWFWESAVTPTLGHRGQRSAHTLLLGPSPHPPTHPAATPGLPEGSAHRSPSPHLPPHPTRVPVAALVVWNAVDTGTLTCL